MRHVWLIGMMGTGKTTVGVLVAELAGMAFHDIDADIMQATGQTVPELFAEGESVFRSHESAAIERASLESPMVIATGGGAVLASTNVETMRATGTIVLLTATVETIVERIADSDDRPLATDPAALDAIARLRLATYTGASDHVVDTEGRDPHDIAREVYACIVM